MTSNASDTAKTVKTRTRRTKRETAARAAGLVASARDLAGQVGGIVDKVPGAAETVKGSAMEAYRTVDTLPKPQQRKLASISLAIGALLFLTGAPKLLTFLALLPAVVVGGTRWANRAR